MSSYMEYFNNLVAKPAVRYDRDSLSRDLWLAWIAKAPLAELRDFEEHAPARHCVFLARAGHMTDGKRAKGNPLTVAFYARVAELDGTK